MKKDVIHKLIDSLKKQGATDIKSLGINVESPETLNFKFGKKSFVPDVVATYPNRKDFFSIEKTINNGNISELISKWILFGLEARKNNGEFYVLVPEKQLDYCKGIIERKQMTAKILPSIT